MVSSSKRLMDTSTLLLIVVVTIIIFSLLSLTLFYILIYWRKGHSPSVQPLDQAVTSATVTVRLEEERIPGVEQAQTRYLHRYAKIRV